MEVSGTIMEYIPLIWCCVDYGFCEMCKINRLLYLYYGIVRRNERWSIEERDMNSGIVILTGTDVGTK